MQIRITKPMWDSPNLVARDRKCNVDADIIDEVKDFKPTCGES